MSKQHERVFHTMKVNNEKVIEAQENVTTVDIKYLREK